MSSHETEYQSHLEVYPINISGNTFADDFTDGSLREDVNLFTPEKLEVIHNAFESIQNQLQLPFTTAGVSNEPFIAERKWFHTKTTDKARFYHGMIFGDLLIAAIAGEGKIFSLAEGKGALGIP